MDIAGNRPNMQVVNGFYAFHIADNAEQLIGMDVFRRAFHQNVQSLFKQLPAAAPYQSRHQYAGNRIRPLPAIRHHQYRCDNHPYRAEQIADYMQIRAAHINVFFGIAIFQHINGDADVDQQPDDTDHQHAARQNFRRIKQSFDCLIKNHRRNQHQRQSVKHRRQNFKTFVTESLLQRGLFLAKFECPQCHTQRKRIAEHMPRIGKQGQRVGQPAADRLNQHKSGNNKK